MERNHDAGTRRRRAFTLAEVLISLAIMSIVAAVVYPTVMSRVRSSVSSSLMQTLVGLSQGIAEYKRAVTHYPGSLLLLTTAPVSTDLDICGNETGSTAVALYRGPYASRVILSTGIPMGDGAIMPGLRRVTSGTSTYLLIDVANVPQQVADDLELQLDGTSTDATAGTIRYTSSAIAATTTSAAIAAAESGNTNLSFAIPINSC